MPATSTLWEIGVQGLQRHSLVSVLAGPGAIRARAQDEFAVRSHKKAAAARAAGKFKAEIVPVATKLVDPKTGAETKVIISEDDGIRASTTMESLGALKAVFKKNGTTTAGNSSQVRRLCALIVTRALMRTWPLHPACPSLCSVI